MSGNAPRLHRVSARDGLELAALEWPGDAARTPVLGLHGLTRSALDFRSLAERQEGRRRVLALDLAGHGDSARAPDPARYGFEAALRDVLDAMAALHAPRVVVVGTSLGGLLGLAMAVVRPGMLRGLVMNDIGPQIEAGGLEFVQSFVATDPACPTLEDAVLHLKGVLPPVRLDGDAAWRRFTAATYARGEDGRWHPRWDVRIASLIEAGSITLPPLWPLYRALCNRPAMLVWGEESHLLSRDTVLRMRREKRDLAFVSVADAGHAPTLEEPEVTDALDAFLADIP
jgi:pimeloyl-ACP methyl ester carboxylesterase